MSVEKRRTFNEVAELYDLMRPRYPDELFTDLVGISRLPDGGRILEVGAGTGIATLPLAERGYEIVCVELGEDLAAVARKKLAKFDNVEVVTSSFEHWRLPSKPFDLVMSATAWHWLDPEVAYLKAAKALRAGGALAIFGYHHVAGGDQGFFERVQDCYMRFMPGTDPDERLQDPSDYRPDTDKLEASGLFNAPEIRTYESEANHTRAEYLDLLSTYSGHRTLDDEARQGLFDCIGSLIDRDFGGRIRKRYLTDLVVAQVKIPSAAA